MIKYQNYKDTNINWLGKIPDEWKLSRVHKFFEQRNVKVDDVSFKPLSVTMQGVKNQLEDVVKSDDGSNRKLVKKGDFVINSRSDRKGASGIAPRDGSVSLIYIVLKPRNIHSGFVSYLFKSYYFEEEFFRIGKGIHWDLWTTRWDQLKNIYIPLPPEKEQQQICEFLDTKNKEIDLIIKKINDKNALLNEQKLNLISNCTTKGLNPNIKLKKSFIDWIDKTPEHWKMIKPKYILNKVTRPIDQDDDVITCFRDGTVTLRKNKREDGFTFSIKEHGYQQILPGDLVVHEMDGFAGAIGISDSKGKSTPVYTVIEPNKKIDLLYFSFLLREMSRSGKIESLSRSIRERTTDFRWNVWSNIFFSFPPIEEQIQISSFLTKNIKKIESVIEKNKKLISLFKEYGQSLNYFFATGKYKVK